MNRFIAFARIGLLGFAAASIPLSTGCGLDVNVGGSTGTGGHTGAGGSCSNVAVGSGVGGAPDTSAASTVGSGGAPDTSAASTGTGPAPVFCGGNTPFPTPPCAADEYCDYGPNNCGSFDNQGICTKRPVGACPPVFELTCGCDGQTHTSLCDTFKAGTDVNLYGGCMPPVGQFACGAEFCDQKTDVCVKTQSDVLDEAPTFACAPIPAGCGGIPTCACISTIQCGSTCENTSDGGHRVTCYEGG